MMSLILFSTLEHESIIGTAFRSIRLLRLFRIIHMFFRTLTIFEGSRLMYILVFAFASILLGAFGEYLVESSVEGTKITTFGDALWWSIATVTTVGYGNVYSVTTAGKVIDSLLMIIGRMVLSLTLKTASCTRQTHISTPSCDNSSTNTVMHTISVGDWPWSIVFNP